MSKFWLLLLGPWIFIEIAQAAYDPLSVPNNRYGVHILDPAEIESAAKLVNSSGGDWGYVTIPIRSDDRDVTKWSAFFEQARKFHLIPILRLATYHDPVNGGWVPPTPYDLIDFANFLSGFPWPTQNRYVILFNEPNHAKEWGGGVNPARYASLLIDASDIFRSRSADFFLLSAGLDMSAPTAADSLEALEFYRRMSQAQPNWTQAVDGHSVHAYPNPAFTASPYSTSRFGITSFRFEQKYLSKLGMHPKPIFITETGSLSPAKFYPEAFSVWTDENIAAITPFLLHASQGPFQGFSLTDSQSQPKTAYYDIFRLPKSAGSPLLSTYTPPPPAPISSQSPESKFAETNPIMNNISNLWIKLFPPPKRQKISINEKQFDVEIADTPKKIELGLSGRENLPPDSGMLFVFEKPASYPFWMKDMRFSLDFIWISNRKVVQISENVLPPDASHPVPTTITPDQPVDHVLEVTAGFVKNHAININDEVDYRP
ncbi:hypothetical protein A2899_02745 [Candidatus Amesbacteria bacterium RIFCSPLOWO2_01_FULL_49_25]|uniref:DUF192 domain-containing protein n=1 Tax=Candidatus Amesbacteria bacterium RIFCSPHIGHO2_01_FULL_48_32b TaxID=1797253 RepID=A0A1F4YFR2_9BACT|nr:MAG: hypothetical protein A2876_04280 [Candidatus Amesbacteria bacterium RIFCSPHIGHO2_01_FULL_48_32b]OGD08264.1 MAG: hypothetical protein A2899_02745 [Candidatus Amesbacteria bacterium RIFCSPLOWO2_01_FULL_49_25]